MTMIHFEQLEKRCEKSGVCGCGKRRKRSTTFWQTINPFNKTFDGHMKGPSDIYPELDAMCGKWQEEPITCDKCGHLAGGNAARTEEGG